MKAVEAHKMSDQEIREEEQRLRTRIFTLRSQAVTEKLENPRELGGVKKDLARLLTEKRQRAIKANPVEHHKVVHHSGHGAGSSQKLGTARRPHVNDFKRPARTKRGGANRKGVIKQIRNKVLAS